MKLPCCLIGRDGYRRPYQDRSCIQPLIHLHDAHPRFAIPGQYRPLDGCGAAPPRQQRRMNIEAAVRRNGQHGSREDEPVRRHDHHICLDVAESVDDRRIPQRSWLLYRQPKRERPLLDRRHQRLTSTSGWPVGLSKHQRNVMSGSDKGIKRRCSEAGRSCIYDFQGVFPVQGRGHRRRKCGIRPVPPPARGGIMTLTGYYIARRCCLRIRVAILSRFSRDRYSTKTLPSR